jgi:cytidylate kinase
LVYVDTGALYRTVALAASRRGIPLTDGPALERLMAGIHLRPVRTADGMRMLLDGTDVTDAIRGEQAGYAASTVSALPEVRRGLLALQRELGRDGGIVMDGRDIGTVIFPDAEVKFFLTADAGERGRRRWMEMRAAGRDCTLDQVIEEIRRRDLQDTTRAESPLRPADDAIRIDSTGLDPATVVARLREHLVFFLTKG